MTGITSASLTRARLRFRAPVRYGHHELADQEVGILRLMTDSGLVGLGEVAGPVMPAGIEAELERTRRALLGREPAEVDVPAGDLAAAIDTAILDLQGQLEARPMVDLLGGGSASVAVNALLVLTGSPNADAAAARTLLEAGYRTLKLKPAIDAPDVDASLRAIRDTAGRDVRLRLDLNGNLDVADAIAWLGRLEVLSLEYVEQPVAPWLGVAALARVRRSIPMPLAADESVTDVAAAIALLDAQACDVLVVKPARVGGPRPSVRICRAAAAAGVVVTVSNLYESGIGRAAALHVAATIAGERAHGLGTGELLLTDLTGNVNPVAKGRLAVPSGFGLGVALDEAAVPRPVVPA